VDGRPLKEAARARSERPTTIDDYLACVEPERRAALQKLRNASLLQNHGANISTL